MSTGAIITIVVFFLGALAVIFFTAPWLHKAVECLCNNVLTFLLHPFRRLIRRADDFLQALSGQKGWGGPVLPVLFGVMGIVVIGYVLIGSFVDSAVAPGEVLLYGTTVGSLIEMGEAGLGFDISGLVSAAFFALLSFLVIDHTKQLHWCARLVYNAVFLCFCSISAYWLSDLFALFGQWFLTALDNLIHSPVFRGVTDLSSLGKAAWAAILLLVMLYPAVIALVIALQELLATFCYGLLPIPLFLGAILALELLLPNGLPDVMTGILVILMLISGEFVRAYHDSVLLRWIYHRQKHTSAAPPPVEEYGL